MCLLDSFEPKDTLRNRKLIEETAAHAKLLVMFDTAGRHSTFGFNSITKLDQAIRNKLVSGSEGRQSQSGQARR